MKKIGGEERNKNESENGINKSETEVERGGERRLCVKVENKYGI